MSGDKPIVLAGGVPIGKITSWDPKSSPAMHIGIDHGLGPDRTEMTIFCKSRTVGTIRVEKLMVDWPQLADIFEAGIAGAPTPEQMAELAEMRARGSDFQDEEDEDEVPCRFCGKMVPAETAHLHQGKWVGECCWDER